MLAEVETMFYTRTAPWHGLECKTASAYSVDNWKNGHIPESYQFQCYHGHVVRKWRYTG